MTKFTPRNGNIYGDVKFFFSSLRQPQNKHMKFHRHSAKIVPFSSLSLSGFVKQKPDSGFKIHQLNRGELCAHIGFSTEKVLEFKETNHTDRQTASRMADIKHVRMAEESAQFTCDDKIFVTLERNSNNVWQRIIFIYFCRRIFSND